MTNHRVDKGTLTGPQIAVLRWIAAGCPDGVYADYAHRLSARALENRGLVRIWGRGKSWRAETTSNGTAAVESLAGVSTDVPADISSVVPSPVDLLLTRAVDAGAPLDVGSEFTRDELQRLTHEALKSPARPHAKRLSYKSTDGWRNTQFRVSLTPYFEDTVELRPVPVPEHPGKLHPLARSLREDKEVGFSREHLTRAVRILHALAVEAEQRSMNVSRPRADAALRLGPPRKAQKGDITIETGGDRVTLELRELPPNKGAARPRIWDNSWRGWDSRPRLIRNEKFTSTGVLQLAVLTEYGAGEHYRDARGRTLENLLPAVLRDVELRHLYLTESRAQREREAEERREVRWRQFDRAKHAFADDTRVKHLDEQVER